MVSPDTVIPICGWRLTRVVAEPRGLYCVTLPDAARVGRIADISIAQSLEDGAYPEDPSLSGEVSWYNPLTGMLLASVRSLNGQSLMRIAVMAGPFVNILAPAAFYLLVALLFGHSAALAGLCLFLFGKEGTSPSHWTCAYTPWLLAPVYSTGLLFLTLALFKKALEKKTAGYFIMAGLLLGITFLAHTAPAVIAGATMTLLTIVEMYRAVRRDGLPGEARRLAACLFMVVYRFLRLLPYTGPILWRYQFGGIQPSCMLPRMWNYRT